MYGIESQDRDAISWNNNSGASAINVSYWLGAKRIVLLGFDMRMVDGKKNYHTDYKGERKNSSIFERHLRGFQQISEDAKQLGIEILNATPNSAVTQFLFVKLEDVI